MLEGDAIATHRAATVPIEITKRVVVNRAHQGQRLPTGAGNDTQPGEICVSKKIV